MFLNITKGDNTTGVLWKRLLSNNQKIPLWYDMKQFDLYFIY